jgi:putative PIN family toxin of toxin-antitoxin system
VILVFDSCVWVSAIQFGGTPLEALDRAMGQFQIALCQPILTEIHSVLHGKFHWREAAINETLAEYALETSMVQINGALRGICRDPKDDMVLECAVVAGADLIVTGDKDLLVVGNYQGVRILTSRQFLDEFSVQSEA